ncbi:MAG: MarR family transcriptional regulator [Ancylobacter novellus]|uniref:MarR family transcriptional regulator n=1 Tax=Ancylobacter novellus TaxID=921 RepID=A0A2W5QNU1_ANCNO|nr:MAG: MarR family transcriptional regulator [Ancylobacter novellus]
MAARPAKDRSHSAGSAEDDGVTSQSSANAIGETPAESIVTHLEIARLIERAHRRFLDLLRIELARLGTDDISPSQVMLLFTIGNDELSVRDLLERGHYLGSNASYNLKQLVDAGYVHRSASLRDRRSARLRLTTKAQHLCDSIRSMHDKVNGSGGREESEAYELGITYTVLRRLEILWTGSLRYGEGG